MVARLQTREGIEAEAVRRAHHPPTLQGRATGGAGREEGGAAGESPCCRGGPSDGADIDWCGIEAEAGVWLVVGEEGLFADVSLSIGGDGASEWEERYWGEPEKATKRKGKCGMRWMGML